MSENLNYVYMGQRLRSGKDAAAHMHYMTCHDMHVHGGSSD